MICCILVYVLFPRASSIYYDQGWSITQSFSFRPGHCFCVSFNSMLSCLFALLHSSSHCLDCSASLIWFLIFQLLVSQTNNYLFLVNCFVFFLPFSSSTVCFLHQYFQTGLSSHKSMFFAFRNSWNGFSFFSRQRSDYTIWFIYIILIKI